MAIVKISPYGIEDATARFRAQELAQETAKAIEA